MTGVELIKLLQKSGFKTVRIKGSHYKMQKNDISVIVPHHHKELGKGITNNILKKAGLR